MFGLSFSEILLIAIPLVFLWISIKRDRDKNARQAAPPSPLSEAEDMEAEDMTACAVCGDYRPIKLRDPLRARRLPFLKSS